jgi:hypothetical protein
LATRSFSIEIKEGIEGGTKPTLAYTVGGLCEFELATIEVSAGALSISSGDITNTTVIIDPRPNLDERFDAKMNADFSNTTMVRWPVEVSAKENMPNWYVVYNDGWCEQGGITGTDAGLQTITFPKEYIAVPILLANPISNAAFQRDVRDMNPNTVTKSNFTYFNYLATRWHWASKGYIN